MAETARYMFETKCAPSKMSATVAAAILRRARWVGNSEGVSSGSGRDRIVPRSCFGLAGCAYTAEMRLEVFKRSIYNSQELPRYCSIDTVFDGSVFLEHPAPVADAMAVESWQAVIQAESLMMLPRCC